MTHEAHHTTPHRQPFVGAADGLIEALFPSTQRRASETTASSSTSTLLHHPLGGAGAAAAAAGATAAAAGGGQGLGLDSPPPAYAEISNSASPLVRFPHTDPPTQPAGMTAAAAGSTGGRPVPPDEGRQEQPQQQPAAAATEVRFMSMTRYRFCSTISTTHQFDAGLDGRR